MLHRINTISLTIYNQVLQHTANRPHLHVSPGWEGFNPNQQLPPTTGAPPTTAQSNAQPARTAAPSPKTSKEQRVRDAWLEGYETVALQIEREHQEQARRQQDKDEFSERAARQWAKATGSPRPSPPTSAKKRKQNPPVGSPESATPDSADRSPPPNKRKTHGTARKPVDLTKTKKTPRKDDGSQCLRVNAREEVISPPLSE